MKATLRFAIVALAIPLLAASCRNKTSLPPQPTQLAIEHAMLHDTASFYYVDRSTKFADAALPIGVFDSGTGGLTVLDALVRFDANNNDSHAVGSDGKPDFSREKFIYLADQANMPYGNYYAQGKSDLLVEHILKDAQFLLSTKYYASSSSDSYCTDKQAVKAIVIACNTATAYGKDSIVAFLKRAGITVPVIGVIDAGAKGALETFSANESGSIGVFATVGTIASKGYENTIVRMKNEMGYSGNIEIYNQGGHGVAEAVDEESDFIDHNAKAPRTDYRGPSLDSKEYSIDRSLMDIYQFDFSSYKMLCDSKQTDDCSILQINDSENYIRYHLVSLMEQLRKAKAQPLKAIILGCTHYPYLTNIIREVLNELYSYKRDGVYYYRDVMSSNIHIIDPAENVAIELYAYLNSQQMFSQSGAISESEFYISVPNTANKGVVTDEQGRFTYDYKYGRNAGEVQEYVKVVPFSRLNIPNEITSRLEALVPQTFNLIVEFNQSNPKVGAMDKGDRISTKQ